MIDDPIISSLVTAVRQTAFELHTFLRWGHLERVYENGLTHRLRKAGLHIETQKRIEVSDEDGTVIGDYVADMVLEGLILIELKACSALAAEHIAQVLGYLRATGLKHGMLINFGAPVLQIKKLVL